VHLHGSAHVTAASNIKNIGQGIVQIRDTAMKTAVLVGTSSRTGAGPAQRIQPIEGTGVAVTGGSETGGVYVAASTGRVGINDASSRFDGQLHVRGDIKSGKLVLPYTGMGGAAMLLESASNHDTVTLGRAETAKLRYSIGRGSLADRTLSLSVPGMSEYGGAGKAPLVIYQSPKKVLAAFKAGTAQFFVAGDMNIQEAVTSKRRSKLSDMYVHGQIHLEGGRVSDDATMHFPSSSKQSSFSIRAGTSGAATAVDTKLFLTGNKGKVRIGINSLQPKTELDVRGHINLESSSQGNAAIYFPTSGSSQGFYVRSSSTKPDASQDTRFFIHPAGKTGINTIDPHHGLCLQPKPGTPNSADMLIKKGNLHLNGGLRDLDGKHQLSLDDGNSFKALNIEMGLAVTRAMKVSEELDNVLQIEGSNAPTLLISQEMMKPVAVVLQASKRSWTIQGTTTDFNILVPKKASASLQISKNGQLDIGKEKTKAKFAFNIATAAKNGAVANSIFIARGSLRLQGSINKLSSYKGRPIVWQLYPAGFSNMKDIQVKGRMVIGSDRKFPWSLYVEQGRTIDVGGSGFLYAKDGKGTLSFNEYVVSKGHQHEKKVHDKKARAAAVRLVDTGGVHFEGAALKGQLDMSKLMSIQPARGVITFEKHSNFGLEKSKAGFPLRVKGGSKQKMSAIAFGHVRSSMGLLGSTAGFAYLGTRDEKKFIAVQHDGKVGMGTVTVTEELTVRTKKAHSDIYLTSKKQPGKFVTMTMQASSSVKFAAGGGTRDVKSGKCLINGFAKLVFANAGSKSVTLFDRGNRPKQLPKGASFASPHTEFRSGNVGIGVKSPRKLVHVGGNHWSQGKLIVKNGFGKANMVADLTAMIQIGEASQHANLATELSTSVNVGHVISIFARLARKNKQRLKNQAVSIALMEQGLLSLM